MSERSDYQTAQAAQTLAADPAHSAWVIANAGSGKTKVLIDRVARLLLKDASPDSILCVTYTKAAANEMLGRLYATLGAWSVMGADELATKLSKLEGGGRDYNDAALRQARSLFARALETPGGLRIETIHAFCSRVLRRFPLEAGVAPGFQEIEEAEAGALWDQAAKEAILAAADADPETLDVVSLACGGLGARAGIDALKSRSGQVLDFAATHGGDASAMSSAIRKALGAPDMSEAEFLEQAMGTDLPREALAAVLPEISTAGGAADKKLAEALTLVLSDAPAEERYAAYMKALAGTKWNWPPKSNPFTGAANKSEHVGDLFMRHQDHAEGTEITRLKCVQSDLNAIQTASRTIALITLSLPALHTYTRLKRERAALDFDDLITHTSALLSDASAAAWVLYKLDGGLTHVLLDEAQDTSPEQWRLLNALTGEFFAGTGRERAQDPRTLFVVGDEKQSIYSFQGADPEKFFTQRQEFEAQLRQATSPAVLPEMAMSFRSAPEILSFVDTVFDTDAFDGHPFLINPPPEAELLRHTAHRAAQAGCVEFWPLDPPEVDDMPDPWDAPLDAEKESSPKARLAARIAQRIKDMIDTGESVWDNSGSDNPRQRPVEAGDILILVRGRKGGLFDALIAALKRQGLPVAGADRLVLKDHIAVQDCLNLIRFALMPEDDLTLAEILRGPFCGLVNDDAHLFPLAHNRGEASLWSRLQASQDPAHDGAKAMLESVQEQRGLAPFEFLSEVLEQPGPNGQTGWDRLLARLGSPARDPVDALLARALSHDASGPASLQTFLAAMEADDGEIKRDLAAPQGEVRVMTVHGAKGLEAPVVILPDTTSDVKTGKAGLLMLSAETPAWAAKKDDDPEALRKARDAAEARDLREHRRLLYVALTRAEDRLIICGAWHGAKPNPEKEDGPNGRADKSWHALCEAAMGRLSPHEDDVRDVRLYGALPNCVKAADAEPGQAKAPTWLRAPAPIEADAIRYAAPTSLVPGEAPIIPPFGPDTADRLKRGRLIHALLERLPELAPETRETAARDFLAHDISLSEARRDEILTVTHAVLNDPAFEQVFAPGGRAEAAIIGTAPELPDGMIINGRIDRLVITETEILIVDFKTDRPAPAEASNIGASYLAQMAAYRAVLRRAWPNRTVRCALLWTDGPKLMPLPDALLDDAITSLRAEV